MSRVGSGRVWRCSKYHQSGRATLTRPHPGPARPASSDLTRQKPCFLLRSPAYLYTAGACCMLRLGAVLQREGI